MTTAAPALGGVKELIKVRLQDLPLLSREEEQKCRQAIVDWAQAKKSDPRASLGAWLNMRFQSSTPEFTQNLVCRESLLAGLRQEPNLSPEVQKDLRDEIMKRPATRF